MIAEHITDDGTQYILDSAKPDFALVVIPPNGIETSTIFDYAEVHDDCIGLYRRGGEEFVGEITDGLQHSSIRSAMKAIESCQLDP